MPGLAAERHLARLDIPEPASLSVVVGSQARRALVGVVDIGGDFRFLRTGFAAWFNAYVHVQRLGHHLRRAFRRLAAADDLHGDVPRCDGGTARGCIRIPESVSLKTATLPFAGAETGGDGHESLATERLVHRRQFAERAVAAVDGEHGLDPARRLGEVDASVDSPVVGGICRADRSVRGLGDQSVHIAQSHHIAEDPVAGFDMRVDPETGAQSAGMGILGAVVLHEHRCRQSARGQPFDRGACEGVGRIGMRHRGRRNRCNEHRGRKADAHRSSLGSEQHRDLRWFDGDQSLVAAAREEVHAM